MENGSVHTPNYSMFSLLLQLKSKSGFQETESVQQQLHCSCLTELQSYRCKAVALLTARVPFADIQDVSAYHYNYISGELIEALLLQ